MSEAFVHLMCFYLTYVVTVLCDPRASFFRIRGCKDMRKEESLWNHSVSHPCPSLRFTQVHTHAHTHTRAFTHMQASALWYWNKVSRVPEQTLFHLEEVFDFYPSKTLSG